MIPIHLSGTGEPRGSREAIRFADHLALLAIPALAFGVVLLLSYSFPKGDELDHLVILRRFLNPGYLLNDWYTTVAIQSLVRMPYLLLMAGPVSLIGEAATFAIVTALVSVGTVYLIGLALRRAGAPLPAAVFASVGMLLRAAQPFSVGDTQIIGPELIPADFAWLLAFASFVLGLSERRRIPALLTAAAATLFTPQIGMLAYGAHLMLAAQRSEWRNQRSVVTFALGGLLVFLWPALLFSEGGGDRAVLTSIQVFEYPPHWILSARAPIDFDFPVLGHIAFDRLWTVPIGFALVAVPWALGRRYHPLLYWALVLATGAACLSIVAGERGGPPALISFQGMRLSVVLGPLALGAAGWLAWDIVRTTRLRRVADFALSTGVSAAVIVLAAGVIAFALITAAPALGPDDVALRDATIAATPADAIVLVPPDLDWFRVETNRAIVVEWKAWPFQPSYAIEWKTRLETLAPGFDGRSPDPGKFMARAFDAQPPERLLDAADKYGATYILVRRQDLSCSGGRERVRLASGYVLYALAEARWHDPARTCAASPEGSHPIGGAQHSSGPSGPVTRP